MEGQQLLPGIAPSHVYVAAHHTPHGWDLRFTKSSIGPFGPVAVQEDYSALSTQELFDVVTALLDAALGL